MRPYGAVLVLVICLGCGSREARIRDGLARGAGTVQLPPGVTEISSELAIPEGARDLVLTGSPSGSVLRASAAFRGTALVRVGRGTNIRLTGFSIDGNRTALARPAGLAPSDVPFCRFTVNNGILAEDVQGLTVSSIQLTEVAGFAVLVARSSRVMIENVQVENSGSKNEKGRNNTTGGILIEEGTSGFQVLNCTLRNVLGNGIWTHSLYTSPRNRDGRISGNVLEDIGRDALQAGHATGVRIENNSGRRIGYPPEAVDVENGAIPVAIDTAGNVDKSVYAGNRFEEVNGKCIDLDGFHHGEVSHNSCVNRGSAEDYPHGHYGIVFNNSNPDMQSEGILISQNTIDGAKFGGIFVIGSRNRITENSLRNLNLARCNESGAKYGCLYYPEEPDLLRSGIYLGKGAHRPAPARGNLVEANEVSGYGMDGRCIAAAPGVSLAANRVENNRCEGR
ncbi:MAG TPA: right-handed parallel beta-helix repeat-containing protein [Bryobacteraceae bacterium]|nr:right-handed parallel beta-helix repeat-containing protein [Bryobacteraceae bacterium]